MPKAESCPECGAELFGGLCGNVNCELFQKKADKIAKRLRRSPRRRKRGHRRKKRSKARVDDTIPGEIDLPGKDSILIHFGYSSAGAWEGRAKDRRATLMQIFEHPLKTEPKAQNEKRIRDVYGEPLTQTRKDGIASRLEDRLKKYYWNKFEDATDRRNRDLKWFQREAKAAAHAPQPSPSTQEKSRISEITERLQQLDTEDPWAKSPETLAADEAAAEEAAAKKAAAEAKLRTHVKSMAKPHIENGGFRFVTIDHLDDVTSTVFGSIREPGKGADHDDTVIQSVIQTVADQKEKELLLEAERRREKAAEERKKSLPMCGTWVNKGKQPYTLEISLSDDEGDSSLYPVLKKDESPCEISRISTTISRISTTPSRAFSSTAPPDQIIRIKLKFTQKLSIFNHDWELILEFPAPGSKANQYRRRPPLGDKVMEALRRRVYEPGSIPLGTAMEGPLDPILFEKESPSAAPEEAVEKEAVDLCEKCGSANCKMPGKSKCQRRARSKARHSS